MTETGRILKDLNNSRKEARRRNAALNKPVSLAMTKVVNLYHPTEGTATFTYYGTHVELRKMHKHSVVVNRIYTHAVAAKAIAQALANKWVYE